MLQAHRHRRRRRWWVRMRVMEGGAQWQRQWESLERYTSAWDGHTSTAVGRKGWFCEIAENSEKKRKILQRGKFEMREWKEIVKQRKKKWWDKGEDKKDSLTNPCWTLRDRMSLFSVVEVRVTVHSPTFHALLYVPYSWVFQLVLSPIRSTTSFFVQLSWGLNRLHYMLLRV